MRAIVEEAVRKSLVRLEMPGQSLLSYYSDAELVEALERLSMLEGYMKGNLDAVEIARTTMAKLTRNV